MDEPEHLERLPKADRNSELQQLSINALNSALPVDKFVLRDERITDAGVDASLELKINSRYTNLRAQIQLKSTDSTDTNEDGSVSIQVTVENLNYLLMGAQSPLYILFIATRNELRFAWAADERQRLDASRPGWEQQKTVSIRFNILLDAQAIEQIHERIQREARLRGKLSDTLGRASNAESVVVSIDSETLNVTDPERAKQILLKSGTLIVTAGYPKRVRDLARILDLETAQMPRILLVRAYAEYVLARYQTAYGLLSEALLRRDELSPDDRQFLGFLRDGCDHQAGKITTQELAARIDEQDLSQGGSFADSHRIEQLRYRALLSHDPVAQKTVVDELRSLVSRVLEESNTSEVFKLYARSSLLDAEGFQITHAAHIEIGESRMKVQVGVPANIPEMLRRHWEQFNAWQSTVVGLINDAFRIGHPNLIAQAILQKAVVSFQYLANQRVFSLLFNCPMSLPEEDVMKLIEDASRASGMYAQANQLEGELRAEMVRADFLELVGREAEAKEIANKVLPMAKAMDYTIIVSRAEEHISGQGYRRKLEAVHAKKSEEEKVASSANMSDEKLREYAAQALKIYGLPATRLPVMEREYASIRDVAREQLGWCRHIDRRNDDWHERHPATMYRTDPHRICICNLHGFRSSNTNPDWKLLSVAFKRRYCEKCPDRNPFQQPQETAK